MARHRMLHAPRELPNEDRAWLALLVGAGLYLLFSERFWNLLPF